MSVGPGSRVIKDARQRHKKLERHNQFNPNTNLKKGNNLYLHIILVPCKHAEISICILSGNALYLSILRDNNKLKTKEIGASNMRQTDVCYLIKRLTFKKFLLNRHDLTAFIP